MQRVRFHKLHQRIFLSLRVAMGKRVCVYMHHSVCSTCPRVYYVVQIKPMPIKTDVVVKRVVQEGKSSLLSFFASVLRFIPYFAFLFLFLSLFRFHFLSFFLSHPFSLSLALFRSLSSQAEDKSRMCCVSSWNMQFHLLRHVRR